MTIEEHPLQPFLPTDARVLFLGSFPPPKARWSMELFYPNWINDFWRIQGLIHFGDKGYFECAGEKRFDRERVVAFCREQGIALFDTARRVRRLKGNADDNFLEIVEGTDVFALMEQLPACRTLVTTGGKASEELQSYLASRGLSVRIPKVGECVTLDERRGGSGSSSSSGDGGGFGSGSGSGSGSGFGSGSGDGGGFGGDGGVFHGGVFHGGVSDGGVSDGGRGPIRWWRMPSSSRAYPMKLEKKAEYYRRVCRNASADLPL